MIENTDTIEARIVVWLVRLGLFLCGIIFGVGLLETGRFLLEHIR